MAPNTPPAVAVAAVKGGLEAAANGLADGIAPFNGAPKRVPEAAGLGAKQGYYILTKTFFFCVVFFNMDFTVSY